MCFYFWGIYPVHCVVTTTRGHNISAILTVVSDHLQCVKIPEEY